MEARKWQNLRNLRKFQDIFFQNPSGSNLNYIFFQRDRRPGLLLIYKLHILLYICLFPTDATVIFIQCQTRAHISGNTPNKHFSSTPSVEIQSMLLSGGLECVALSQNQTTVLFQTFFNYEKKLATVYQGKELEITQMKNSQITHRRLVKNINILNILEYACIVLKFQA